MVSQQQPQQHQESNVQHHVEAFAIDDEKRYDSLLHGYRPMISASTMKMEYDAVPIVEAIPACRSRSGSGCSILQEDVPRWKCVTIFKETADTRLGINFERDENEGHLRISRLRPGGLLESSPLRLGDKLVSINHMPCYGSDASQVVQRLRRMKNTVSIMVETMHGNPHLMQVMVMKTTPEDKVGISLQKDKEGRMRISNLAERTSSLTHAPLSVGDQVISINRMSCHNVDGIVAASLIGALPREVVLLIRPQECVRSRLAKRSSVTPLLGQTTSGAAEAELPQARFRSVSVCNASPTTKLGIRLTKEGDDGGLFITGLRKEEGYLFSSSPLCVGDKLITINDVPCSHWQPQAALNHLKEVIANQGTLSLLVENPQGDACILEATAVKPLRESRLGIRFTSGDSALAIENIADDGLLGQSILNVGDDVISINGIPCSNMTAVTAASLLRDLQGPVTIQAKLRGISAVATPITAATDPCDDFLFDELQQELCHQPAYRSVTVFKESLDTKLGINFERHFTDGDKKGQLRISVLRENGLLADSPLRLGDHVLSINNKSCDKMSPKKAVLFLKDIVGPVSIVAENADDEADPHLVQAMVIKPTSDATLGIRLTRTTKNLKIVNISPDSAFVQSVLNVGDKILSINGVPCQDMETTVAAGLLRSLPNKVVLLTKTLTETGVVLSQQSKRSRFKRNSQRAA